VSTTWLRGDINRGDGRAVHLLDFVDPFGGYDRIDRWPGTTEFYKGDVEHRLDGPSSVCLDHATKVVWRVNGVLHRVDGPAVFEKWLANHTDKYRHIAPPGKSSTSPRWMRVAIWADDGRIHRYDGPAVTWKDGTQEWWRNGFRFRQDLPAVVCADGSLEWHGCPDGEESQYRDDDHFEVHGYLSSSGNQFYRKTGPSVITPGGTRIWGTGWSVSNWNVPVSGPWLAYPDGNMRFADDPHELVGPDHPRVVAVQREGRAYVEELFETASLSLGLLLTSKPGETLDDLWRASGIERRIDIANRALWALRVGQGNLPYEEEQMTKRWVSEFERTVDDQREEILLWRQEMKGYLPVAIRRLPELSVANLGDLERQLRKAGLPVSDARAQYVEESTLLMVTITVAPLDIAVPSEIGVRDVVDPLVTRKPRTVRLRTELYVSGVSEIALGTLAVADACISGASETVVLNVMVDDVDRATGHSERYCTLSVRTDWQRFRDLDLKNVDPLACVRSLGAAVPRPAKELAPVRPIIEFDRDDPRFVPADQIASSLDSRANLMELTPNEFESLIQNLFESIGLDTQQTQASRDGGVDCIAYDSRPIFGGKIVIQAKRYTGTVGVSAVRDLYGTMLNEGAMKGLLVTTSGYGKASFEFANNKPIELLGGANLLHLLKEHLGVDAIIVPPDDWADVAPQ